VPICDNPGGSLTTLSKCRNKALFLYHCSIPIKVGPAVHIMQSCRILNTSHSSAGPLRGSTAGFNVGHMKMTPAAVGLGQVCRRGVSVAARSSDTTSSDTAGHPGGSGGGAPPKLLQRAAAALCAAAMVLAPMPGVPNGLLDPAIAADVGKVGTCLLSKCQGALARCLADGPCLQVRGAAAFDSVCGTRLQRGGGRARRPPSRTPRRCMTDGCCCWCTLRPSPAWADRPKQGLTRVILSHLQWQLVLNYNVPPCFFIISPR
jgi:hypothetical protein